MASKFREGLITLTKLAIFVGILGGFYIHLNDSHWSAKAGEALEERVQENEINQSFRDARIEKNAAKKEARKYPEDEEIQQEYLDALEDYEIIKEQRKHLMEKQ